MPTDPNISSLYAESRRLRLGGGYEIEALTSVRDDHPPRPKCLLLHGNPGSLQDWAPLVSRLSRAVDIAAIDLPGFGRSPRIGEGSAALNLDRMAEHTIAALDALGWHEPVHLVGHSHGGGIAQTVAAQYPTRVGGLVLVATLGGRVHTSYRLMSLPGAGAMARRVGALLSARAFGPLNRAILRGVMRDIFSPEAVPVEKLDAQLAVFVSRPEILVSMVHVALGHPCAQLLKSAKRIRCPTIVVHGDQDALVPAISARSIHDEILRAGGRSEFQLVERGGHMLIEYQAQELADIVLRSVS